MADIRQLHQRARHFYQKGKFADAARQYQKLLKQQPGSVEIINMYGISLAQAGDMPRAAAQFTRILELDPTNISAHENLSRALMQMHRYQQAQDVLEKLTVITPDNYDAHYKLGGALMSQNKLQEALESFMRALAINSSEAQLHINLATVYFMLERYEAAVEHFNRAIVIDPENHQAHLRLGQLYLKLNRYELAEKMFSRAAEQERSDYDTALGYAEALQHTGQNDAAFEQYLVADSLSPGSQNVYTKMDKLILQSGPAEKRELLAKLETAYIYETWQQAVADASRLAVMTGYHDSDSLKALADFFRDYDPSRIHSSEWWRDRLKKFGDPAAGHDKILRGIHSAVFSWSLPDSESLSRVAEFIGEQRLYSYGSGAAYWERLLSDHFDIDVVATDFSPRHSFIDVEVEDYSRSTLSPDDAIFLAWIIRDDKGVFNLLDQFSSGQKLIIVGEPPDKQGIPRICGSTRMFEQLEEQFNLIQELTLVSYSMLNDTVRLYVRK